MSVLEGIMVMAVRDAVVIVMLVVMVVIAMPVRVRVRNSVKMFVQMEVGSVFVLGLILSAIDFHNRPFAT